MSSTKQRQEERRRQQRLEKLKANHFKADEKLLNSHYFKWSKVGLYNVRPEESATANIIRSKKQESSFFPIGNQWSCWTNNTRNYVCFEWEIFKQKSERLEWLGYDQDRLRYTPHALERLWQRSGQPMDAEPQRDLGILGLGNYLEYLHDTTFHRIDQTVAARSDIIVPFRQGAFLGVITTADTGLGLKRIGTRLEMCPLIFKNISPVPTAYNIHNNIPQYRSFRAETWIHNDLLRSDQREICDNLRAGQYDIAATRMSQIESFQYEQVETADRQYAQVLSETIDKLPLIRKLYDF